MKQSNYHGDNADLELLSFRVGDVYGSNLIDVSPKFSGDVITGTLQARADTPNDTLAALIPTRQQD